MDILAIIAIALSCAIFIAGGIVTFFPPETRRQKRGWLAFFVLMGVTTMILQIIQGRSEAKAERDLAQALATLQEGVGEIKSDNERPIEVTMPEIKFPVSEPQLPGVGFIQPVGRESAEEYFVGFAIRNTGPTNASQLRYIQGAQISDRVLTADEEEAAWQLFMKGSPLSAWSNPQPIGINDPIHISPAFMEGDQLKNHRDNPDSQFYVLIMASYSDGKKTRTVELCKRFRRQIVNPCAAHNGIRK